MSHATPTVYRLTDAAIRRDLVRRGGLTPDSFVYALVLGLGIGLVGRAPLWLLIVIYGLFVLLHIKGLRHFTQLKENWRGFELIVETDRVQEWRGGSLESTIMKSEVTRILELPGRGLWILGAERGKRIEIPWLLNGYRELRATLASWTDIKRERPLPFWQYLGLPAAETLYVSTLLVRSPYVFFPLMAFAGFYLLQFCWISIKSWTRRDLQTGVLQEPVWVPAIPFVMLALLVSKAVWMVR